MNAANPWLATVSRGTEKRSLIQFLFGLLVPHGFLRLPAGSRGFSSLTHSLVSVLVFLLCFSTAWLECDGGQREDTGQVVLLTLLAY